MAPPTPGQIYADRIELDIREAATLAIAAKLRDGSLNNLPDRDVHTVLQAAIRETIARYPWWVRATYHAIMLRGRMQIWAAIVRKYPGYAVSRWRRGLPLT